MTAAGDGRPLRALFVAHSFPRSADDLAGSFLLRLAVALRERGVEVTAVAPAAAGAAPRERLRGVDVVRYRYAPRPLERIAYTGNMAQDVRGSWGARAALAGLLAAGAAAVRREARRAAAMVVHAHWWFPGAVSAVAAHTGLPLVVTLHGSDVRLGRTVGPARRAFAAVARRASAVTAVSRWLCDEALGMAPGSSCAVAPMPVDTELFRPPGPEVVRRGWLFVGRLSEQKGGAYFLRAAAARDESEPITIVGDGPEAAALRALARELDVAHRVRWVAPATQHDLVTLMQRSRALVMPSRDEGLGLIAVEAQLCATPVVGFASGGLSDAVEHGRTGLLVPPGDPDALAGALDAIGADDARARALGAAGRARALDRFSPEAAAATYAALYREAVHARDDRTTPAPAEPRATAVGR